MKLGIDFGTTHTVVAIVDRGNYPAVAFEDGNAIPSCVAVRLADGALRYGTEAAALAEDPDWRLLRSFKRLLHDAGPLTEVAVGGFSLPIAELLVGYLKNVREELLYRSNASIKKRDALEVAVSVPANASSSQRFLTIDAYRRAGFEVLAVLNEPSAAGFEYAHRHRAALTGKREHVVVYDLGGGTFDASLIHMGDRKNQVITSSGVTRLGGDDFDAAIRARVVAAIEPALPDSTLEPLLLECRRVKESVTPQTRRFVVDLTPFERAPLALPMDVVAEACGALVEESLAAMTRLLPAEGDGPTWSDVAAVYVVGGASSFPVVYRRLREELGHSRVKRSPYPFAATAIGLAIFLDEDQGYELTDVLTRHFGVWREAEEGREVSLDVIFRKDTPLPGPGNPPLEATRRYRAAHNLGHFRFVEIGHIGDDRPDGDIVPWDEIRFPFDPALRDSDALADAPVRRLEGTGPDVEEHYRCTAAGTLEVTITVLSDGYRQTYQVARRTARPVRAGRR